MKTYLSLNLSILFILIRAISNKANIINDVFPCYTSSSSVIPIDISQYTKSIYTNINTYFNFTTTFTPEYKYTLSNAGISIEGQFETIFFDLNSDFSLGSSEIVVQYSCSKINITTPSVNKYWDLNTEMEMQVECHLKTELTSQMTNIFSFKDQLVLAFPILYVGSEDATSTLIFTSIANDLNNKDYSSISNIKEFNNNAQKNKYILNNSPNVYDFGTNVVSLEKHILELSDYNNYLQFYFFNGNSLYKCGDIQSYYFFNNFLKINSADYNLIMNFINHFNLNLTEWINSLSYSVLNEDYIDIRRNFHINYIHLEFEDMILSTSGRFISGVFVIIALFGLIIF